jgi:diguanylate cyclase (GGDEF)-like protein/PAS domain S-box-containing protein
MEDCKRRDKVLIVEDSPSTRMIARATIEGLGLEVFEASAGAQALEIFDREEIGLALLDVGLPDIDGFEVAERIRGHERGADTPIIMLTGKNDVESIQRAFDVGATDFASKPVSWLILGHRLLFILESARRQREIVAQRESLEETQRMAQVGRWFYHVDEGRLEVSSSWHDVFGAPPEENLFERICGGSPEPEQQRIRSEFERLIETGRPLKFKHVMIDSDGNERVVYTQARRLEPSNSDAVVVDGHSQDITDREEAEQRAQYLAQHDSLTGLKNQAFFRERLTAILAQQKRDGTINALLLVNLDNFSRVNDIRGREVGDNILRTTAERLIQTVRESDLVTTGVPLDATISRVGGDEFSVVISDIKNPTDVARVAMRILDAIRESIEMDGENVIVTGRIGIAISPEDGDEFGELMANADAANRHSRSVGGSGYDFYRASMNEAARARLGLESDFREALLTKEIQVHYQPRVDMSTGIVGGAEALARWNHKTRGWVSPEEFVQLAEESGLTFEFGRSIVESVMEQMRRWRTAGYEPMPVSINISPTMLIDARLPQLIQEVMDINGIAPSLIEVEITESVLIRRENEATIALGKLKAMGLTVALDDFGTGFSALTHLQRFPVDVVKIDRSFVDALVDETGQAIVRGVISMVHAMGLRVVAEGVENLEQRIFLAEEGCDEEQGFLVSPAVPAAEFEQLFWPKDVASHLVTLTGVEQN